jgi:hypothetical protein
MALHRFRIQRAVTVSGRTCRMAQSTICAISSRYTRNGMRKAALTACGFPHTPGSTRQSVSLLQPNHSGFALNTSLGAAGPTGSVFRPGSTGCRNLHPLLANRQTPRPRAKATTLIVLVVTVVLISASFSKAVPRTLPRFCLLSQINHT